MITLLHFSGPCSFAAFLAAVGDTALQAVKFVRGYENGGVACFLDNAALDETARALVRSAVRAAHAVEPVRLDHDVEMSAAILAFVTDRLSSTP